MTARFEPGDRVKWKDGTRPDGSTVTRRGTYVRYNEFVVGFEHLVRCDEPDPFDEVYVLARVLRPVSATSPHAGGYARVLAGRHRGLRGWLQTSEGGAVLVVTDDGKQHMPEDVDFIRPCTAPPGAVAPQLADVGQTVEVPLDLVMVILARLEEMRSRTLEERLRACLAPGDDRVNDRAPADIARDIRANNAGAFDRLADL